MSKTTREFDKFEAGGMKVVRAHYSALSDTLKTFNVKVSEVLAKAESEFLQAYRAHMVEVHKELQELRGKLAEAESSILKDDYIQQLERDCAWYRNEAAQLTAFVTAMDKDKSYMCRKLRALRNDRQWLSRQLKASKKQHKLLRAELAARVGASAMDSDMAALGGHASRPSAALLASQELAQSKSGAMLAPSGTSLDPKLARGRSAPELGARDGADDATPAVDPDLEWRLRQQIRTAKQLVANEKHVVQQLRASIVNDRLRHSELEEFFLQCTDDVKKETDRGSRAQAASLAGALGVRDGRSRASPMSASVVDELAGPERAVIMRKLLKRKDAFSILFDTIFPPSTTEKADVDAAEERHTDAAPVGLTMARDTHDTLPPRASPRDFLKRRAATRSRCPAHAGTRERHSLGSRPRPASLWFAHLVSDDPAYQKCSLATTGGLRPPRATKSSTKGRICGGGCLLSRGSLRRGRAQAERASETRPPREHRRVVGGAPP